MPSGRCRVACPARPRPRQLRPCQHAATPPRHHALCPGRRLPDEEPPPAPPSRSRDDRRPHHADAARRRPGARAPSQPVLWNRHLGRQHGCREPEQGPHRKAARLDDRLPSLLCTGDSRRHPRPWPPEPGRCHRHHDSHRRIRAGEQPEQDRPNQRRPLPTAGPLGQLRATARPRLVDERLPQRDGHPLPEQLLAEPADRRRLPEGPEVGVPLPLPARSR